MAAAEYKHVVLGLLGAERSALVVLMIVISCITITTNTLSKRRGGKVIREPGPMKHGSTAIAFVEDPDGYKLELIEGR